MLKGPDQTLRIAKGSQIRRVNRRRGQRHMRVIRRVCLEFLPGYVLEVFPPETLALIVTLMSLAGLVKASGYDRPVMKLNDVSATVGMVCVPRADGEDPPLSLVVPRLRIP